MKVNNQLKSTPIIVEIFKTNVKNQLLANKIVSELYKLYPDYRINFDLEDCDNILRIEGRNTIDILGILNYGKSNNIEMKIIYH